MTNEEIMGAMAALPDPEMVTAGKITDELGTHTYYSARTVIELLAKERERCAKLVETMNTEGSDGYIETTGDLCEALAERIRRGP